MAIYCTPGVTICSTDVTDNSGTFLALRHAVFFTVPEKSGIQVAKWLIQKDDIRSSESRVSEWKPKKEKTREEYQCMVKDKVADAEWKYIDANENWQQTTYIMMETAQAICGLSKDPCRHKETWWWNEEDAEAIKEKKSMEITHTHTHTQHTTVLRLCGICPGKPG